MWNPFKKSSWEKVKLALAFGEAAQANNLKPEHIHTAVKYYADKVKNDQGVIKAKGITPGVKHTHIGPEDK